MLQRTSWKFTLKTPGKLDVTARLYGSCFASNPQGYIMGLTHDKLTKMERGVPYTIHPVNKSDKYFLPMKRVLRLKDHSC